MIVQRLEHRRVTRAAPHLLRDGQTRLPEPVLPSLLDGGLLLGSALGVPLVLLLQDQAPGFDDFGNFKNRRPRPLAELRQRPPEAQTQDGRERQQGEDREREIGVLRGHVRTEKNGRRDRVDQTLRRRVPVPGERRRTRSDKRRNQRGHLQHQMRPEQHALPPSGHVEEVHPPRDESRPEPEEDVPRPARDRVARFPSVISREGKRRADPLNRRSDDAVEHLRAPLPLGQTFLRLLLLSSLLLLLLRPTSLHPVFTEQLQRRERRKVQSLGDRAGRRAVVRDGYGPPPRHRTRPPGRRFGRCGWSDSRRSFGRRRRLRSRREQTSLAARHASKQNVVTRRSKDPPPPLSLTVQPIVPFPQRRPVHDSLGDDLRLILGVPPRRRRRARVQRNLPRVRPPQRRQFGAKRDQRQSQRDRQRDDEPRPRRHRALDARAVPRHAHLERLLHRIRASVVDGQRRDVRPLSVGPQRRDGVFLREARVRVAVGATRQ
mmetsp:Transcript_12315/g.51820  ORF Transcript_12315/g.51820 Transcript_12315/m.51820 type:complete len:489 (+) Transcript_12315:3588-5054(+)